MGSEMCIRDSYHCRVSHIDDGEFQPREVVEDVFDSADAKFIGRVAIGVERHGSGGNRAIDAREGRIQTSQKFWDRL